VEIFGTTAGLEQLINALIEAVNHRRGHCEVVASDGSESEVRVACLDGVRRAEDWAQSGSPYLDVEDPVVARVIDLTEENARLRQAVALLRAERAERRRTGPRPPV
jgi:hypothetical protein